MATHKVYHAAGAWALLAGYDDRQAAARWQDSVAAQHDPRYAPYRLVAQVEAPSLAAVFALTNHGAQRGHWPDNPGVRLHTTLRVRSTSVGDVVVAPDGTAWLCAPVGWRRIALPGLPTP